MLYSIEIEELRDSDSGSSGSVEYYLDIFLFLSCDFQGIDKSCEDDYSSSMLIIVHDWDIKLCLQSLFDLEAPRC